MPRLYSGSYGLGSRDLQPEGIIGAIENMLPDGPGRKNFYLGVDFIRDVPLTPKEEIHQQEILDLYPDIKDLAVHGSENPNLLPDNSIAVRIHSIGGWGAMATGKNLTMTLADILGFYIKSNPKYGSEKKGSLPPTICRWRRSRSRSTANISSWTWSCRPIRMCSSIPIRWRG